jgi:hypothetical protein
MLLYILLIAGSIAFGFEALLIGWGGKLTAIYSRRPWFTVALAFELGLLIVISTLILSIFLQWLENRVIYAGALALLLTVIAGKAISPLKSRLIPKREILPPEIPDEEIEKIIERRKAKVKERHR